MYVTCAGLAKELDCSGWCWIRRCHFRDTMLFPIIVGWNFTANAFISCHSVCCIICCAIVSVSMVATKDLELRLCDLG
jgi:hypothetical protein